MTATWGATGVRVAFGATVALDDVSLTAAPGTVNAVVGGDGAGKTTLLRCLAGALAPSSGTVSRPGAIATGYFPASSGVYPDLTVAENLAFRATAYGLRGPDARARIAELTELAGLATAIDRPAGQLSGGMRQKLGVIAAMLHRPALLILDEPSTGVDPVSRSGLWWLITRAAADGAAVVLATTYLDDAQRAGSVLVLDSGRVLAVGPPDQIVADMPGSVHSVAAQPEGTAAPYAWRRSGGWRLWCPPGRAAAGTPVAADLQDAVTVAALRHELTLTGGESAAETAPAPATPIGHDRPLAEAVGVTCRFGQLTAVRDVSVEVRPGEVVGLLGANGAGKTTLIRMLLGLQHASSGTVALLGEPPSRRTRRLIGYVPQGLGLYDDLTAAENMAFAAAIFGSTAIFGGQAPPLPEDFERQAGTVVGMLPLGLQRRLAFAEALAHRPDVLILDEPTSGVDPLGRARLWDTIAAAAAAGAGVLVSTHYMEEASECDRLVVMAGGQVVAAGTARDIIGDAQVTVVRTNEWAAAFSALAAAGISAALAGQALRVPGAGQPAVAAALAGLNPAAQLSSAPATLEERFFELATQTQAVPA
jgi:ABC-2 type transport system ATP-binding protein